MKRLAVTLAVTMAAGGPAAAATGAPGNLDPSRAASVRADLRAASVEHYIAGGAHPLPSFRLHRTGAGGEEPGAARDKDAAENGMLALVFIKFDANQDGKLNRGEYEAAVAYLQAIASRRDSY